MVAQPVLDDLLSLPADDRASLAQLLLESLNPPEKPEHKEIWAKEIRQRFEAWNRGALDSVDPHAAAESLRRVLPR